ncbi:hypothetical protein D915_003050 [Fasciola hepatica]|uniref:Uncharacterized protein n=1 Tax=Fasciola hepatica TaxID=6192 RepID=A0A4E0RWW5_FASHE|nr:hypothetical protein D915_003050 [Fasciola hepatica]
MIYFVLLSGLNQGVVGFMRIAIRVEERMTTIKMITTKDRGRRSKSPIVNHMKALHVFNLWSPKVNQNLETIKFCSWSVSV